MIFLYFYWVDKVARPWKMEALACSFGLPESRLRGICWRRDLIKTSFWYFSEHFGSLFAVLWIGWEARIGLQLGR